MNNNNATLLFRHIDKAAKIEEEIAKKYLSSTNLLTNVKQNQLVIPRYFLYPFHKHFEMEINNLGAKLINSYREHLYVADLKNWYQDLYKHTPQTWFSLQDVPENEGPFVLKGETKSRKDKWNTHCFATDKKEAIQVFCRLQSDGYLEGQEIYIRKYEKLHTYFHDEICGIPITEEYRFFVLDKQVLAGGFYWSSHIDLFEGNVPDYNSVPKSFLNEIIDIVGDNIRFFVVDIARKIDGNWIVIELNDGCSSGTSEVNLDELYLGIKNYLKM